MLTSFLEKCWNSGKIPSSRGDLYRAVLCRARLAAPGTSLSVSEFADFFEERVKNIRAATDGAPPPEFFFRVDSPQVLRQFRTITADEVVKLIQDIPVKAVKLGSNANLAIEELC